MYAKQLHVQTLLQNQNKSAHVNLRSKIIINNQLNTLYSPEENSHLREGAATGTTQWLEQIVTKESEFNNRVSTVGSCISVLMAFESNTAQSETNT